MALLKAHIIEGPFCDTRLTRVVYINSKFPVLLIQQDDELTLLDYYHLKLLLDQLIVVVGQFYCEKELPIWYKILISFLILLFSILVPSIQYIIVDGSWVDKFQLCQFLWVCKGKEK